MSNVIPPHVLNQLRRKRRLSMEALADRSKINKGTIFRIESGKRESQQRKTTIERLADALRVSPDVLTGEAPLPAMQKKPERLKKTSFHLNAMARNAMALTAKRYGVTYEDIVGIAPLLFYLAAERSLQRRHKKMDECKGAQEKVEEFRPVFPYLRDTTFYNTKAQENMELEDKSIRARDIFGKMILEQGGIDPAYPDTYDEIAENPFVQSLREEFAALLPDRENEESAALSPEEENRRKAERAEEAIGGLWSEKDYLLQVRIYRICPEEVMALVGNDREAANGILSGAADLDKRPKEIGHENANPQEVAAWAKKEREKYFILGDEEDQEYSRRTDADKKRGAE